MPNVFLVINQYCQKIANLLKIVFFYKTLCVLLALKTLILVCHTRFENVALNQRYPKFEKNAL